MMKKVVLTLLIAAGTFIGCQDNTTDVQIDEQSKNRYE